MPSGPTIQAPDSSFRRCLSFQLPLQVLVALSLGRTELERVLYWGCTGGRRLWPHHKGLFPVRTHPWQAKQGPGSLQSAQSGSMAVDSLPGYPCRSPQTKGPKVTGKVALERPRDIFGLPDAAHGNTQHAWS